MCGIFGVISPNKSIDSQKFRLSLDTLVHRGPDASGTYIKDAVGLGHRRLSIIDLNPASNQPFRSKCGHYTLVFNGEIFNYLDFKSDLINKGYTLSTHSDTEILLYLLIEYGIQVLEKLVGFWAFAFYNEKNQEIILARDRFGIKPLFYYHESNQLVFASEPKALFQWGIPKEIDENHLDELFLYRHISGENTIFNKIKRLLPGHWMSFNNQGELINTQRWFQLGEEAHKISIPQDPYQWFQEAFHKSIRSRMIADVPVGTMLSGGLDSSSVLYSQIIQGYSQISTWNIAFHNSVHDESAIAKKFSDSLNVPFHSFNFSQDELVQLLEEATYISDEPFMHTQEPHLLGLCKKAKSKVSVLLSGEGADEFLGGYVRHKAINTNPFAKTIIRNFLSIPGITKNNHRLRKLKNFYALNNTDAEILMNANEVFLPEMGEWKVGGWNLIPQYRVQQLKEAKQYFPYNPFRQLLYLETFTHLCTLNDRNDRVSMGASIENREPFEHTDLVTGVFSLPNKYFTTQGKGKNLLFNSIGQQLPDYIRNHRKIGLSIPWMEIIRSTPQLYQHYRHFHKSPLFQLGNLNNIPVSEIKQEYEAGNKSLETLVRRFYFLSYWYNRQFEEQ